MGDRGHCCCIWLYFLTNFCILIGLLCPFVPYNKVYSNRILSITFANISIAWTHWWRVRLVCCHVRGRYLPGNRQRFVATWLYRRHEIWIFNRPFLECIIVRVLNHYGLFQGFRISIKLVANCPLLVPYSLENARFFCLGNVKTLDILQLLLFFIERGQHFEACNSHFQLISVKVCFCVQRESSISQANSICDFRSQCRGTLLI